MRRYIVTLLLEVLSTSKKQAQLDFIEYLANRPIDKKDITTRRSYKTVGVGR